MDLGLIIGVVVAVVVVLVIVVVVAVVMIKKRRSSTSKSKLFYPVVPVLYSYRHLFFSRYCLYRFQSVIGNEILAAFVMLMTTGCICCLPPTLSVG